MPRRPKPPACPRRALLRAKARREALALAADRRADAAARKEARRQAARAAKLARQRATDDLERGYHEAAARPPAPETPVGARIAGRAEATERARWQAIGIDLGD